MNLSLFPEAAPTVTPRGIDLAIHVPEVITKELRMSVLPSGHKRIRLSTNFLPLMGFSPGVRTEMVDLGVNAGILVNFNAQGKSKIYQRTYPQRRNNPLEAVVDIQNQALIERAIPSDSERLHFTLRNGSIFIKPLFNNTFLIRKGIRESVNPFQAFVGLTSGVDIHCLRASGFSIQSILEYRPQEARDKSDLTETGALNAISNAPVKFLFNEDLTKINMGMVGRMLREEEDKTGLLHISLPCDDYSNGKSNSLKQRSIELLDTTIDMVYDALRLVETVQPATIIIENVVGFAKSTSAEILKVKLRKWGYNVTEAILEGPKFKGNTLRKRYYLVASVWPGFEMPQGQEGEPNNLWKIAERHLNDCRDITHTGTVHLGVETGRARLITRTSSHAPTVMKSQARQAKDSIFIFDDGRYYMPSEGLLRELNGIPEDFSLNAVSSTIASEIIGQSIEYPMHEVLMRAIHEHIKINAR